MANLSLCSSGQSQLISIAKSYLGLAGFALKAANGFVPGTIVDNLMAARLILERWGDVAKLIGYGHLHWLICRRWMTENLPIAVNLAGSGGAWLLCARGRSLRSTLLRAETPASTTFMKTTLDPTCACRYGPTVSSQRRRSLKFLFAETSIIAIALGHFVLPPVDRFRPAERRILPPGW